MLFPKDSLLLRITAATLLVLLANTIPLRAITIPAGTTIFGELDEGVSSKKKETTVGDIVRARVWRDVQVDGRVVIEGGAPMVTRVSLVKPAKMAGRKGDVQLEAVSAIAVDGSEVLLDGGYDKSGKGNKALAWTLFALVAWPLIFIKGKNAFLEAGTVFDGTVQTNTEVSVMTSAPFKLHLEDRDTMSLYAEVLYDKMDPEAKHKVLPLTLTACGFDPVNAFVVTVNDKEIAPIPVALGFPGRVDDCFATEATIELKPLAETFVKGINRFQIRAGEVETEVVLEIEL